MRLGIPRRQWPAGGLGAASGRAAATSNASPPPESPAERPCSGPAKGGRQLLHGRAALTWRGGARLLPAMTCGSGRQSRQDAEPGLRRHRRRCRPPRVGGDIIAYRSSREAAPKLPGPSVQTRAAAPTLIRRQRRIRLARPKPPRPLAPQSGQGCLDCRSHRGRRPPPGGRSAGTPVRPVSRSARSRRPPAGARSGRSVWSWSPVPGTARLPRPGSSRSGRDGSSSPSARRTCPASPWR